MPLVTSKELLIKARAGKYAIGAFNANNMEFIQAIVETAEEEKAPVIVQVSQGAIKYAGLEFTANMVKVAGDLASVPVVLHLDHGTDFFQNVRCLKAGFTSLMYDGSAEPFDKNVATTQKITEIAHACAIPVEAELGKVPGTEDKYTQAEVDAMKTDPAQAAKFYELTQTDALAVALGGVHRMLTRTARLDIDRLQKIAAAIPIPLVLHAASGFAEDSIQEGIANGIAKVNVATQLNMAFMKGVRRACEEKPNEVDPRKILIEGKKEVKEIVRFYIRLFGSNGKAVTTGAAGLGGSEVVHAE